MFQAEKKERYHDLVTFVSAKPIKKMARGVEKPGIEIAYTPIRRDGAPHTGDPWTKSAFADSLKSCKNTLTSLREGDAITLELTINGQYKNLAGVIAGHIENPNLITKANSSNQTVVKAAKTDYNERAAKGQALNLAFQVAIAEGRISDDSYILSLVPRMLALGEAVQNGDTKLPTTQPINELQSSSTTVETGAFTTGSIEEAASGGVPTQPTIQQEVVGDTLDDLFGGV